MLIGVLAFMAVAASVVAVVMAQASRRQARVVARWAVRARIGRALAEGVGSPEAIHDVLRLLLPDHADWCLLHLVDNHQVRRAAVVHVDPVAERRMLEAFERTPFVGDAPAGPAKVIRTGQPYLIPNFGSDELAKMPDTRMLLDAGIGSCVSVPLKARGDVLGVLTLVRRTPYAYGDDDVTWAQDLAYRIALSIENGRLFADLRELFEQTVSANFVSTPQGRLIACNQTFVTLLGFDSIDAALATPVARLYANPAERESLITDLRARKRITGYELMLRRRNGDQVLVASNIVGTFDESGALVKISGYLADRSQQKSLDEQIRQTQRLEAVGQMAGGIAHDFNNLLTVIVGCIDLLRDGGALDGGREPLDELEKAAMRAASLTQQLLAFSRRQVLQPRVLDLTELLRAAQPALRRLSPSNVVVMLNLNPGTSRVRIDQEQFDRAIANLVANAVDAMSAGGTLTITTANADLTDEDVARYPYVVPGRYVSVDVRDTGVGMPGGVLARAFEPFFTTKPPGKGTGLGLSTVYGVVKQSGGYVWLTSAPGAGTTVRICLPEAKG